MVLSFLYNRILDKRDQTGPARVCKFLVSAFVDTLEKWHRVVDKHIDMSTFGDDLGGEPFQRHLV